MRLFFLILKRTLFQTRHFKFGSLAQRGRSNPVHCEPAMCSRWPRLCLIPWTTASTVCLARRMWTWLSRASGRRAKSCWLKLWVCTSKITHQEFFSLNPSAAKQIHEQLKKLKLKYWVDAVVFQFNVKWVILLFVLCSDPSSLQVLSGGPEWAEPNGCRPEPVGGRGGPCLQRLQQPAGGGLREVQPRLRWVPGCWHRDGRPHSGRSYMSVP